MMLLWEGDDHAAAYVERAFGAWMSERGATTGSVTEALEIRRLGKEASTPADAAARGPAWDRGIRRPLRLTQRAQVMDTTTS
jgi:hypothetical protein